ncbi:MULTISPECIES: TetR/AcrR family transcriptional regulator [Acidiplasma]|jgi:AcrR family transcriptional regulator|uniref:HTH tetR-type domain-containing protein n=1 Tax=Acidiplasma cupricumulans TaxID=312540 RepID=A0A0Q0XGN3_9ARCH|nr:MULTISPECIES: TetR/AcrR family transcriptional regulator [Acidiplasma]KJE49987.1 hypothetical protein TZ01_02685 [Acidiplasma sp. MBA-1]KQB33782.1 hypothetical protein AOG55_02005 [Acidiplasma cupricumulans]WMT55189.1 MAG: TetR/AcrR family transcriptional regulator [Acidiplasma sp.]
MYNNDIRGSSETRKKIIESAISIFSKYGYSGASMEKITEKAGISKGLIFWYFKKKEDLIIEIAKMSLPLDVINDALMKYSGIELLENIGKNYFKKYASNDMRSLFLYTLSSGSVYPIISDNIKDICTNIVREIAQKTCNDNSIKCEIKVRQFLGALLCYIINPSEIGEEIYLKTLVENYEKI